MLISMKTILDIIANVCNYVLAFFFKIYRGPDDYIVYVIVVAAFIAYADWQFHRRLYKNPVIKSILAAVLFCLICLLLACLNYAMIYEDENTIFYFYIIFLQAVFYTGLLIQLSLVTGYYEHNNTAFQKIS